MIALASGRRSGPRRDAASRTSPGTLCSTSRPWRTGRAWSGRVCTAAGGPPTPSGTSCGRRPSPQGVQDRPVVAVFNGVVWPVVAAPALDAQKPAAVVEVLAEELATGFRAGVQDLALEQRPGGRAHGRGHLQDLLLSRGERGQA